MNSFSEFLEWLNNSQGDDIVIDGKHYILKHNMMLVKNLDVEYFEDIYKEIEFGRSSYENGKQSILTVSLSGKIRKYLCDCRGYMQVTMEFDNVKEMIEYEASSIYPENPNKCLYFYHNTLVFM